VDPQNQKQRQAPAAEPNEPDRHLCEHCGGQTQPEVVKAAFWGERGLVAIEDIPARVCEQCGEQFYDEATARKIEKLVGSPAEAAKRHVLVPVFSLSEDEASGSRAEPSP
jgi:YgiT-type zinc finger domain-containing protein